MCSTLIKVHIFVLTTYPYFDFIYLLSNNYFFFFKKNTDREGLEYPVQEEPLCLKKVTANENPDNDEKPLTHNSTVIGM